MNARIYSCLLKELRIFFFFLLFFFPFGVSANNIQIKEPARVISVSGGYATIEVRLAWENSWRDAENWDAAYLFLKYRTGSGSWTHIPVQLAGNIISSPYTYMTATPNQTTAPGLFIYRDNLGAGNPNVVCKIRWKTNFRQEQFDNGEVQLLAQAIEMVFVPAGPYVLGDSLSANCFADSYGKPITVRTESSNITLGYKDEGGVYQKVTVASSYPKGFQGFYIMKYEVTQEQYVVFLNSLTLNQQKALLSNWGQLKEGDYIFGEPFQVNNRNGIVVAYQFSGDEPMVFANNFNSQNGYNEFDDGQMLACNFMSINDLLAYSSWAGLRPMSEMEFEKACRPVGISSLVKGGYAWNGGMGTSQKAQGITAIGSEQEAITLGNVNFRNGVEGPLRSGIFAAVDDDQQAAGATHWGVMEMSGNVRELCRNVNDWYFYWNRHGDGIYNPGLWSTNLLYYGVRGGGFTSSVEEICVSDRSVREYFSLHSVSYRDSTVGFRAVRTFELGAIDLNPGSISALAQVCPNVEVTIESKDSAFVTGMNNLPIQYEWYLNSIKLEGHTADTLIYSDWKPGTYYNFVRKAVCSIGEKYTNTIRIYVVAPELTAGTITGGTRCDTGMLTVKNTLSANITCDYPIEYTWYIDGVLVKDSLGHPWHADTLRKKWEIGTYKITRRATGFGIVKDATTTVTVTDLRLNPGKIYGGQVTETVEKLITNVQLASVGCGNFTYSWYIDSVLIEGAVEAELRYVFDTAGFYQVIRRVTSDNGTIKDAMDTVIVNEKSAICGRLDSIVVDDEENVYSILAMADDRCWMTQNMRRRDIIHQHAGLNRAVGFDGDNIRYHEGIQSNDNVYGLHYNWNTAMQGKTAEKSQGICPAGWYIPTDEEWRTLEIAYGMPVAQATQTGWRGANQGTQFKIGGNAKFNVTLAGYNATASFNSAGYYWTSTQNSGNAWVRHFTGDARIYRYNDSKGYLWSVRCIRSKCLGGTKPQNLYPGEIKGGIAGVGFPYTIKTVKGATVSCGGIEYSWYINDTLVAGRGASLTHVFKNQGVYRIVRRATADNEKYADTSAIVRVFPACGAKDYVLDDQENRYPIKEMGDARCWMTQSMRRRDVSHQHAGLNKAVDVDGANRYLHEGIQSNDSIYGLHYDWNIAMQGKTVEKSQGICPAGWYIPTDAEWKTLEIAYGMTANQAESTGWRGYDQGTILKAGGTSGFNVRLSGYNATASFNSAGYYWTSTQSGGSAWVRHFTGDARVYRYSDSKGYLWSVRCIRSMCYDEAPKNIQAGLIQGGSSSVNYPIVIKTVSGATVSCGGLDYTWYIGDTIVGGAEGASLTHTFTKAGVYSVKRRATADNGNYAEAVAKVVVYAPCGAYDYVHDQQGNRYTIKEMADGRCWMTQNLRRTDVAHQHAGLNKAVDTDGTNLYTHEGAQANDVVHGCHYDWNTLMRGKTVEKSQGICPLGWYVPTDAEWKTLEMAYGMTAAQANATDWRGYDQGTILKAGGTSGFNVRLSGYNATASFNGAGYYWTSTQNSGNAWVRHFTGDARVYRYNDSKGYLWSLRCIRSRCEDGEEPDSVYAGKIIGGIATPGYAFKIRSESEANVSCGGLYYSWLVDSVLIPDQVGETLIYTFTTTGKHSVIRRATSDNGLVADASTIIAAYSPCLGQDSVYDDQANAYHIKAMADNRCWMTQNLRRTDVAHQHPGINVGVDVDGSNLYTHEGQQKNDVVYGCHYNWNIAMAGSTAEKSQGICPPGWYIPTDAEWKTLEMSYGMTAAQANGTDWRGYNQGTQLKAGGVSGFNINFAGYNAMSYFGSVGYYWTSTQSGGSAWIRHFTSDVRVNRHLESKGYLWSVRCVRSVCMDDDPVMISAGGIKAGNTAVNYPITIKSTATALVSCGGIRYSWYVNNILQQGKIASLLTYTFPHDGMYVIVRRAMADDGRYLDAVDTVRVYTPCSGDKVIYDDQGNDYQVKEMADNRCWMIQNLRRTDVAHQHANLGKAVDTDGTNLYTHEGAQANDAVYGCHYNWNTAMAGSTAEKSQGICPPGWYIPTDAEWKTLEIAYGMTSAQANGTDWRGYNQGTQLKTNGSAGFNINLPGYNATSGFNSTGYYWTSTQNSGNAWVRHFTGDARIYRYNDSKGYLWSVRCIRSSCYGATPLIQTPGSIQGGSTAVSYPITIRNVSTGKVSCGALKYSWYIDGVPVSDVHSSFLTYTFSKNGKYKITRRVTSDNGSTADTSAVVMVYSPCSGNTTVTDEQGHVYRIKEMADNRCWMTQNLRRTDVAHQHPGINVGVDVDGSNLYTHEGQQKNDVVYGCHYNWNIAMAGSTAEKSQGICPPGWYIPTDAEWKTLEMSYGMTAAQANGTDWRGYNQGTQLKAGGVSGFNINFAGYNAMSYFGSVGYYWTSTQSGGSAWIRHFTSDVRVNRHLESKGYLWSVRCIKATCFDEESEVTSAGSIEGGDIGVNYPITIKNKSVATASCGGLGYSWYIEGKLIDGENKATLTYTFSKAGIYIVKRRATMDDDPLKYKEVTTTVRVYTPCAGKTVVYDDQGNDYQVKEMADNRCWMIQNLRRTDVAHQHANLGKAVDTDGTNLYTHEGAQANDAVYGCHYNWNTAMAGSTAEKSQGICPPGWYIPTDAEWKTLEIAYGMTSAQANGTDWRGYNQGTQLKTNGSAGFNINLPGYNATSGFNSTGYYWTSTQNSGNAWVRHFTGDARIYRYNDSKGYLWSVRCIQSQCLNDAPVNLSAGQIGGGKVGVGYPFTISNVAGATVSCGGLVYSWYVNGTKQVNKYGAKLTYTFTSAGNYTIIRRVQDERGNSVDAIAIVQVVHPCEGATTVVDAQGNSYSVKEMADTRCWMTQNMRRTDVAHQHANLGKAVDVDGSTLHYHDGAQANDVVYGCHYDWNTAMQGTATEKSQGICPSGWYIPTDTEWLLLERSYGMTVAQSNGTGWRGYNQGTQLKAGGTSGFNVTLPGYNATSSFGGAGYYWTSTQNGGSAWVRHFTGDVRVYRYSDSKGYLWSVRCIKK